MDSHADIGPSSRRDPPQPPHPPEDDHQLQRPPRIQRRGSSGERLNIFPLAKVLPDSLISFNAGARSGENCPSKTDTPNDPCAIGGGTSAKRSRDSEPRDPESKRQVGLSPDSVNTSPRSIVRADTVNTSSRSMVRLPPSTSASPNHVTFRPAEVCGIVTPPPPLTLDDFLLSSPIPPIPPILTYSLNAGQQPTTSRTAAATKLNSQPIASSSGVPDKSNEQHKRLSTSSLSKTLKDVDLDGTPSLQFDAEDIEDKASNTGTHACALPMDLGVQTFADSSQSQLIQSAEAQKFNTVHRRMRKNRTTPEKPLRTNVFIETTKTYKEISKLLRESRYHASILNCIQTLDRSGYVLTFTDADTANKFKTRNEGIELDSLPKRNTNKPEKLHDVIIYDVPLDMSTSDIHQELENEYNIQIHNTYRMQRTQQQPHNTEERNYTRSIKITLDADNLSTLQERNPTSVTIFFHRFRMALMTPKFEPTQCVRCWAFNHPTHRCPRSAPKCKICAKNHSYTACPYKELKTHQYDHCINCKGSHRATWPKCPVYTQERERQLTALGGPVRASRSESALGTRRLGPPPAGAVRPQQTTISTTNNLTEAERAILRSNQYNDSGALISQAQTAPTYARVVLQQPTNEQQIPNTTNTTSARQPTPPSPLPQRSPSRTQRRTEAAKQPAKPAITQPKNDAQYNFPSTIEVDEPYETIHFFGQFNDHLKLMVQQQQSYHIPLPRYIQMMTIINDMFNNLILLYKPHLPVHKHVLDSRGQIFQDRT